MSKEFLFQLTAQEAIDAIAERVLQLQANQTQQQPNQQQKGQEPPITIPEACKLLRVSKPTLHSWMAKGQIPFHRKGRRVFLFRSEVLESLQQPVGRRRQ